MTQRMNTGNSIMPLRNVAALATTIHRVENRRFGMPGMATFSGPTGLGKTFAAGHAVANLNAVYISIQKLWTTKEMLTSVLRELAI